MSTTIRVFLPLALLLACDASLRAETLDGIVIVKKKLTKRRITASIPMYQRGPVVELGADPEADPMAFERSRVAVYIEGQAPAQRAPETPVRMDQISRRFLPEFLVVEVGSRVSFPNLDPIFHNVFSLSSAKSFDLGNYPKGDTRVVTFTKPGIISVNCHLHANMSGTIVVAPNKWNARAGSDGRFEFADVPPGQYTVVAWHKAAGFFRQQVNVEKGRGGHAEFLVPIDDDLPRHETAVTSYPGGR